MDDRWAAALIGEIAPPHVYAIQRACSSSGTKYPPDWSHMPTKASPGRSG